MPGTLAQNAFPTRKRRLFNMENALVFSIAFTGLTVAVAEDRAIRSGGAACSGPWRLQLSLCLPVFFSVFPCG